MADDTETLLPNDDITLDQTSINYPEFTKPPNKNPTNGLTVYSSNTSCLSCDQYLGLSESITVMPCKHAFHGSCVRNFMFLTNNRECPECYPREDLETEKDELVAEETKNRRELLKDQYKKDHLSYRQRRRLIGSSWKAIKTKIDKKYLKEHPIVMEHLLKAKVSLLDLYFSLKVRKFIELKKLGLDIKTILSEKKNFPISQLIVLYGIQYKDLADIGFLLDDINKLGIEADELRNLGLNFDLLIKSGLKKKIFEKFDFSLMECRESLGMESKHLFELGLNNNSIHRMNWDPYQVSKTFNLQKTEIRRMGFSEDSNQNEYYATAKISNKFSNNNNNTTKKKKTQKISKKKYQQLKGG